MNDILELDEIVSIEELPDGEIFDLTIDEETPNYFTADGLLHHNSGKDYVCALIQCYLTYILLCMKNPQQFLGIGAGEPCDILNIGSKGDQAQRVYFTKLKSRILTWKWLLERYNVVNEGKRFSYRGKGFPVCNIGKNSIEFVDKQIRAFSENSGNPQSIEGYNIIFFICDEISGWKSDKGRELAREILGILRTSQTSRNTKFRTGLGMAISYPRQDDDIMFEFEAESKQEDSRTFFSRAFWWDIRPKRDQSGDRFKFNAGTEEQPEWYDVPVELDEDFFRKYPDNAKCAYLLKPPPVGGQFFEYIEKVDNISYTNRQTLFKVATELVDSTDGSGRKIQYVRKRILGLNGAPQKGVDYVVWLDAAESTCDASLSVGHKELVTLIESGERRETTVVVLDDTIVWEPNKDLRIIVDIESMTRCVLDMRKFISIGAAWWDQWNSGTGTKTLRDANIPCDKHNLNTEDYDFFKGTVYENRFFAPKCPQVEKGVGQLKHLSRSRTNIVPGSNHHKKDIADTWCGIVTLLLGNLAQKNLRMGHAPTSITIMGTSSGSGSDSGVAGVTANRANNPFSAPMGTQNGPGRVRDHSDLFRALSPSLSSSGRIGSGNHTLAPRSLDQAAKSRFPRGIRM